MQTTGLPASRPSSSRNAENFVSDKPSHAGEQFGDVMNRALHSGTGILPVRPESHGTNAKTTSRQNSNEHDSDRKSSDLKPKKSLRRAATDQPATNQSAAANPLLIALVAPTPLTPTPSPSQSIGNTHASPDTDDPLAPLSADATNTVVTNANTAETEKNDSSAKPIFAGMEAQSETAESSGALEHSQNPPSANLSKDLANALDTPTAEPFTDSADTAKSAISEDSSPPLTQTDDPKGIVEPRSASPPDPHGIPAAKQDMTMKKTEKMQKVAGSAEQDLPGNTATGSEELPKGQKVSEKAPFHGEKAESTAIELPTRISTSVESPSATITSAAPTAAASFDTRVLERTHDIVALHAMRLTDTGSESLHVVVKPGAGIQLSLELRQSARGIEVSASLHKGDYDQLNRHWPELQQRLEARGIRVSTLTPSENYTGTGHHFHQSKQQSSQQESLHAGAFAEFALAGSMTEPPSARAARASAYRGWETWA